MAKISLTFLLIAAVLAAWCVFGLLRRKLFASRRARALRQFRGDRDALRAAFLEAAGASGKPRGLRWRDLQLDDRLVLARDRANGEWVGLAGATISFEAVAGGDMENVEAVGNLRAGTAVFTMESPAGGPVAG